jgi:hypothetical protein
VNVTDNKLRAAINSLSKRERRAFELASAGANAAAIAKELDISRLGAKRLVDRARWRIKSALKGEARATGRRRGGSPPDRRAESAGQLMTGEDLDQVEDAGGDDGDFPESDNGPIEHHDGAA